MAERKSGPVKPPVIDLKARAAPLRTGTEPTPQPETGASADTGTAPGAPEANRAVPPATDTAAAAKPSRPVEADASAGTQPSSHSAGSTADQGAGSDAPQAATTKTDTPKAAPLPPRPPARLAMPWSAISIAAIGGALLGAGLIYLLAAWIPLPSAAPQVADPAPRLEALTRQLAALEERQAALDERGTDTQLSLDATIQQLDSGLADTQQAVAALQDAMPAALGTELSEIESQLQTLESQLSATAAGASSTDAAALAESLTGIEADIATLDGRVDELAQGLSGTDAAVARLDNRLAAISAGDAGAAGGTLAPAVKLPLIVSGLESAFASGRPFAAELQSLGAVLPDLEVPEAVTTAAASGLTRPELLIARFEERLPDMLAARAGTSTGDWSEDAIGWAKALLALRPAGEIEGNSPEAVVSRLEAAMERRDFIAASGLLQELPEPMRLAAGELAADIQLHAEADALITDLRAQALAPAEVAR